MTRINYLNSVHIEIFLYVIYVPNMMDTKDPPGDMTSDSSGGGSIFYSSRRCEGVSWNTRRRVRGL